jgi:thiamine phosphate synthase YjbQ (UPF0047 family)
MTAADTVRPAQALTFVRSGLAVSGGRFYFGAWEQIPGGELDGRGN